MPPKATSLRLSELDPKTVAAEVQAQVTQHVERLFRVGGMPKHYMVPANPAAPGDLALAVLDLVEYAKTGDSDVELPWPEFASDLAALYSTPVGPAPIDGFHNECDANTPLGLAVIAAYGRHLLGTGEPVEARHIYTLASLGKSAFSQLAAAGDIPPRASNARPAQWSAQVATKWLKARGVPGI